MAGKRRTPEQIIAKLREAEVGLTQGQTVAQVCKAIGVTEQTFYRWRNEYGGLKLDQVKRLKKLEKENTRLRRAVADLTLVDNQILKEVVEGNFLSPARRRNCVDHVIEALGVSERKACRALGQPRSSHRYQAVAASDEDALTADVIELASQYGRYGYRRITVMLRRLGWKVTHRRVERIWRCEGLRVPRKQPKRGRLWLTDGSCVRLRPAGRNHVWAYDFVAARTHDGRPFRILTIIDEYTRECLAIKVARSIRSHDVLDCLADLCVMKGVPEHIRSDNGPEFTARVVRSWIGRVGAKALFIEPGALGITAMWRASTANSGTSS